MATLCVVDTNVDLIIISNNSCRKCIEKKMNLEILKEHQINKSDIKEYLSLNIKAYNSPCNGACGKIKKDLKSTSTTTLKSTPISSPPKPSTASSGTALHPIVNNQNKSNDGKKKDDKDSDDDDSDDGVDYDSKGNNK